MDMEEKNNLITIHQQKVLLQLYNNKENSVAFKTQDVYVNQQCFNTAMTRLANFGVLQKKKSIKINMQKSRSIYELTIKGMLFVEKFILEYREKNVTL